MRPRGRELVEHTAKTLVVKIFHQNFQIVNRIAIIRSLQYISNNPHSHGDDHDADF